MLENGYLTERSPGATGPKDPLEPGPDATMQRQASCAEDANGPDQPAIGPEPASPAATRLSDEIAGLVQAFAERSVTVQELLDVLHGRAFTLLILLLALPFCTPIPLPGVSAPFGLVIAIIGFRLSLRRKPWLPDRLLGTRLPPKFFTRLLGATRRLVLFLEYFLRPRLTFLLDLQVLHHLYGTVICVCGLLLLLPMPIPLSNGFPALTVVLIACAILERDGNFVVAGLVAFLFTLCFFAAIFWGGTEVVALLRETLGRVLAPDDVPLP